jgi:hypothetical protein
MPCTPIICPSPGRGDDATVFIIKADLSGADREADVDLPSTEKGCNDALRLFHRSVMLTHINLGPPIAKRQVEFRCLQFYGGGFSKAVVGALNIR